VLSWKPRSDGTLTGSDSGGGGGIAAVTVPLKLENDRNIESKVQLSKLTDETRVVVVGAQLKILFALSAPQRFHFFFVFFRFLVSEELHTTHRNL
jgi:hypothetical protein